MPRNRSTKSLWIAIAAILVFLTSATPGYAAGTSASSFADMGRAMMSWLDAWLENLSVPAYDGNTVASAESDRSSPAGESVTGEADPAPCELVCTEAGPFGDPDG